MCGHGDSFVFEQAGRIVGTFVLREGADPAYAKLYSGRWLSQAVAYATIHRIAGTGEVRGLLSHAVAYARKRHQHLRIDTHRDNAVMQKAINKAGFVYCGIIHCRDGSDRLAYEWLGKTSHLYEKNGDALTQRSSIPVFFDVRLWPRARSCGCLPDGNQAVSALPTVLRPNSSDTLMSDETIKVTGTRQQTSMKKLR